VRDLGKARKKFDCEFTRNPRRGNKKDCGELYRRKKFVISAIVRVELARKRCLAARPGLGGREGKSIFIDCPESFHAIVVISLSSFPTFICSPINSRSKKLYPPSRSHKYDSEAPITEAFEQSTGN
jgi:hypothetical protein